MSYHSGQEVDQTDVLPCSANQSAASLQTTWNTLLLVGWSIYPHLLAESAIEMKCRLVKRVVFYNVVSFASLASGLPVVLVQM